ncbi:hypothetical protein Patl1_03477 [Pistacia atlantica]|uniref:Uncharacterized protein n=1 Tax=Pistacia atlantica TaxID=434234 RepID=A0ACC1C7P3_9ROSI|nr:hypothetical protein Patl1_03477 [Pistacia atlantica]
MRFFRRIAGLLGLARDNGSEVKEGEDEVDDSPVNNRPNFQETGLPRKGFGVKVQVPVERPQQRPVLVPCTSGDGGVQNLGVVEGMIWAFEVKKHHAGCLAKAHAWSFMFKHALCTICVQNSLPALADIWLSIDSMGLGWYAKRLRIDEDGDVADEFLDEVSSHTSASMEEQHRPLPTFEVRYTTRPAIVKNQVLTPDGKIQQCVEYQGRLQWV